MKRKIWMTILLLGVAGLTSAEWFHVRRVDDWNRVTIVRQEGSDHATTVRIGNLDLRSYGRKSKKKILLGGKDAHQFAKQLLGNQVVWVDNMRTLDGERVADIYPSYERVIDTFCKHKMVNTNVVNAKIHKDIKYAYKNMLENMASALPDDIAYEKSTVTYKALEWYKNKGQFMPAVVQRMFTQWLEDYQTCAPRKEEILKVKMKYLRENCDLYQNFL